METAVEQYNWALSSQSKRVIQRRFEMTVIMCQKNLRTELKNMYSFGVAWTGEKLWVVTKRQWVYCGIPININETQPIDINLSYSMKAMIDV